MNLFDMLKAEKDIPVSDPMARLWGYQYQQKHGVSEISGVPPLRFTSRGGYLQDCRIYGNTVQNGIPTPETPVEVLGCGEYDSELNGYKIPVTVSNGTNSVITPVYVGSEPLHKIGDYADYVDYARKVVVRRIKKLVLTGTEDYAWFKSVTRNYAWYLFPSAIGTITYVPFYCSHGETVTDVSDYVYGKVYCDNTFNLGIFDSSINSTKNLNNSLAQRYANGTPVTVWYVLAEPEEEPLENLLPIRTIKGTNILTADTTVQPSEMYIKGKIKPIGGNEND